MIKNYTKLLCIKLIIDHLYHNQESTTYFKWKLYFKGGLFSENVWKAWEKAAPIDRVKGPDLFSQIHQKQQEPFQEEQQSGEMTRISENCPN